MSEHKRPPSDDENTSQELKSFDEVQYSHIIRKVDLRLLPIVTLFYLLSFLDRANIGNAKVAGMAKDLNLVGLKYNIIAAVFFIPYALAEVPSNIALKLFRPSIWIPTIMVAWGTVMTLMSLCKTYHSLIIARVFLGLAEGGLFPGVTFYLSLWYRRRDVAFRIAIFFSAATIAGAFGGILAYGIERMEGIGHLHGWQWIFLLEGLFTVIVAVLGYFVMHDYPETATFLTESEKEVLLDTLKKDRYGQATHFDMKFVRQAFADYKSYVQIFLYLGILIPVYAIALFLPTIINQLGFTAAHAQLLSVPPFVAGCIVTLLAGFLSDRYQSRGPFIIGCCTLAMVGYILLYCTASPQAGYAGAVLAAMGVYPNVAIHLAWVASMVGGDMRKGVVIAMVIGFSNLGGGVCASFVYKDPPRFHIGHGTMLGCLSLTIILSLYNMWDFTRRNKQKIEQCKREGIDDSRWVDFQEMGSESPLFRYTL